MTTFNQQRLAAIAAIATTCVLLAGCPSNGSTPATSTNKIASISTAGAPSTTASTTSTAPTTSTSTTTAPTTSKSTTTTPTTSKSTTTTPTTSTSTTSKSNPSPTLSVTLSWTAPALNTNGTILNDLMGYHIHYGTSASALTQTVAVYGAATTTGVVANLTAGTYYFAVSAYTSAGTESAPSATVSKTI